VHGDGERERERERAAPGLQPSQTVDVNANLLVARTRQTQLLGQPADRAVRLGNRHVGRIDVRDRGDEPEIDSRRGGGHAVKDGWIGRTEGSRLRVSFAPLVAACHKRRPR
jgi:hypothetical protein